MMDFANAMLAIIVFQLFVLGVILVKATNLIVATLRETRSPYR